MGQMIKRFILNSHLWGISTHTQVPDPSMTTRVTGMNYETIRNIAKKIDMKTGTRTQVPHCAPVYEASTNYSTKQDRRQAMHTKSDTLQRLMRSGAWVICPNLPQD